MGNYQKIEIGSIVLYHLSDGAGGMDDHPGIILKVIDKDKGIIKIKVISESDFIVNGILAGDVSNTYSLKTL